ncbi:hypothetical protein BC332_17521 [Capsicum chinense]|nr:hypothetical protein BC332_17521 [Capsicum chinense]
MDRYQKVEKPRQELPINENEIRITSQGIVRNYITYATTLLQERNGKEIVLKAMGQAISKTVAIAEIIKRRIPRLHQDAAISSVSITDVWEPIEEGLLPYQAPSEPQQTNYYNDNNNNYAPRYNYQPRQLQPPPRQAQAVYNAGNEESYGRGQGRDRGRGRGWSRGGYANYQDGYNNYQENGGYSNWGRGGGRGGWGYRGSGYGRGRGGGGRGYGYGYGYGRGRGRMGNHPRGGSNNQA